MQRPLATCSAAVLAAAMLCSGCSGSQIGGEERPAPWIANELSMDEPTPFDMTGEEAWALVAGSRAALLTYSDGTSTELTVVATLSKQRVRYARQVSEGEADAAGPDARVEDGQLGYSIGEALIFDVALGFDTADGGFSESWSDLAVMLRDEPARLDHEFSADEMQGSHPLPPSDFARAQIEFAAGGGSAGGQLEAVQAPQCSSGQDCPPPQRETFATFGPP